MLKLDRVTVLCSSLTFYNLCALPIAVPQEQSWREPVPSLLFATCSTTQWHTDGSLSFQTTCSLGATRKGYRKNPALFSLERSLPKCTELVLPPPCHHLRGWRTEPPPEPNGISRCLELQYPTLPRCPLLLSQPHTSRRCPWPCSVRAQGHSMYYPPESPSGTQSLLH